MQDKDQVMDKVIELSRAVERAKAELDAKRFELFMYIQEIGNPREIQKVKERVAKEAIAGLQPTVKVHIRRDALAVDARNARRKGTPTIAHQDDVIHCLRIAKKPIATSTVMNAIGLDYAKTLWVLEYLAKAKRVKITSTTPVKHRGKLISVRRWAIA